MLVSLVMNREAHTVLIQHVHDLAAVVIRVVGIPEPVPIATQRCLTFVRVRVKDELEVRVDHFVRRLDLDLSELYANRATALRSVVVVFFAEQPNFDVGVAEQLLQRNVQT